MSFSTCRTGLVRCFLVLLMLFAVEAGWAQSISNGGFEGAPVRTATCANVTGEIAQGWNENTCWDGSAPVVEFAQDNVNPRSGLSAQRVVLKQGRRAELAQFVSARLDPGTNYEVRLWLRGTDAKFLTVTLRQSAAPYRVYFNKVVKLAPVWREHVLSAVTPGGDVALIVSAETPMTYWVDDASLSVASGGRLASLPATAIPRSYFGMHFNDADTPWPADGGTLGALRIWDAGGNADGSGTGAQWADISPARGVYQWSGLDARVAAAQAKQADVLMTLGGRTPRWASARPDETSETPGGGSPYGPGQAAEPASLQDWRDWVTAVATRYKGRIRHWEIWNEPMYKYFYTGTPDKLLELWREAHTILKAIDPANQVLTPSGDVGYLDYLLSSGGLAYSDIVNTHYYVDRPEDVHAVDGQNLLQMLQRVGARGKPLWNSEAGWLDFSDPPVRMTQEQGAAYVARAYLLNWANGVLRFYWYTWDNRANQFAMRETDGITPSRAGRAYFEVARWMTGSVMEAFNIDAQGNHIVRLRRANGVTAFALWNPLGSTSFPVPAVWNAVSERDLSGITRTRSSGGTITLGISPILLESAQPTAGSELVVDNMRAGFKDAARTYTGGWCDSGVAGAYGTGSLFSCGTGRDTYRWTPNLPASGVYDVYVRWTAHALRSSSTPFTVTHKNGSSVRTYDQRVNGGQWSLHGRYEFNAGTAGHVLVSDINGRASADAVKFVPTSGGPLPPPPPPPPPAAVGSPTVLFTDVPAGPVTDGPDGMGVPIAIFGQGFGAQRGTSKVTINGTEVARYLVWGQRNASNPALDMIVVQPGPSATAGAVVVTVNGISSNATHTFTPTAGRVFIVAPTGSDAASCSLSTPCASVLHVATTVMQAGDALLVRGGVMNDDEVWIRREYGHSGTAARPKIIRNYPGETPVFSRGNRPFILDADHLVLSGIRFENRKSLVVGYETGVGVRAYNNVFRGAIEYDAIGTHGRDIILAGNHCEVTGSTQGTQGHCYYISNGGDIQLRYNVARGAPGYGIHIFDQRRSANDYKRTITNVLVEGNLLTGSTQRSGLIVAMGDEAGLGNHIDGVTIRNNLFVANNFAGIALGGNTRNVRIHHNTFYRNGRQGITLYNDASLAGVQIHNNLIDQTANAHCTSNCSWYQTAHIERGAAALNVAASNNFYAPAPSLLLGLIDITPRAGMADFVDGVNGDFHLKSGSQAIDVGLGSATSPTDFDGRTRPVGALPDAGAFEFR